MAPLLLPCVFALLLIASSSSLQGSSSLVRPRFRALLDTSSAGGSDGGSGVSAQNDDNRPYNYNITNGAANAGNRKQRHGGKGRILCTTMKKTYFGLSSGSFITRDRGFWRRQKDGSARYEVSSCQLQRFTSLEARKCFSGHHMLMIGDSTMRYQFLSLAYFIEHGKWPARFLGEGVNCRHINELGQPTCASLDEPSVASENDWATLYGHAVDKSWKKMHECIGGKCFRGKMDCQCVRNDGDTSTENMFYQDYVMSRSTTNSNNNNDNNIDSKNGGGGVGDDENARLKLSFLSNLGQTPMHAWQRNGCEEKGMCNLTSDGWEELRKLAINKSWNHSAVVDQFIDNYIPILLPDVDIAIYNAALWLGSFPTKDYVDPIFKSLFKLVNRNLKRPDLSGDQVLSPQQRGRCFYKGSGPGFDGATGMGTQSSSLFTSRDDEARISAAQAGCGIFDVTEVTKHFSTFTWGGQEGRPGCCGNDLEMMNVYFDANHFQPWVSEELNQILLNILC